MQSASTTRRCSSNCSKPSPESGVTCGRRTRDDVLDPLRDAGGQRLLPGLCDSVYRPRWCLVRAEETQVARERSCLVYVTHLAAGGLTACSVRGHYPFVLVIGAIGNRRRRQPSRGIALWGWRCMARFSRRNDLRVIQTGFQVLCPGFAIHATVRRRVTGFCLRTSG